MSNRGNNRNENGQGYQIIPIPEKVPQDFVSILPGVKLDQAMWEVLVRQCYPAAKDLRAIKLALGWCAMKGISPLDKPLHIVPMWSSKDGCLVETVWPSIGYAQTVAHRTGQYGGCSEPKFGPMISRTFYGEAWENNHKVPVSYTVTFPEWCKRTVLRIVNGVVSEFTEQIFWEEIYARQGGKESELPNEMWRKSPRGQIAKCAKAAALRAGFPEESFGYMAEEMEGQILGNMSKPSRKGSTSPDGSKPVGEVVLDGDYEDVSNENSTTSATLDELFIPSSADEDVGARITRVSKEIGKLMKGVENALHNADGSIWSAARQRIEEKYSGGVQTFVLALLDHYEANQATLRALKPNNPDTFNRVTTALARAIPGGRPKMEKAIAGAGSSPDPADRDYAVNVLRTFADILFPQATEAQVAA